MSRSRHSCEHSATPRRVLIFEFRVFCAFCAFRDVWQHATEPAYFLGERRREWRRVPKRYWARLRADLDVPLRRGAWYEVRRLRPPEAVLDVLGERVSVPRAVLEISTAAPNRWSVVPRPKNPARFPGVAEYAVCPNCRERVPLEERLALLECRRCHEVSDVDWYENYFTEP